jgi:hypothetical protein
VQEIDFAFDSIAFSDDVFEIADRWRENRAQGFGGRSARVRLAMSMPGKSERLVSERGVGQCRPCSGMVVIEGWGENQMIQIDEWR